MDIRKEYELLKSVNKEGLDNGEKFFSELNSSRYNSISLNYSKIFEIADKRIKNQEIDKNFDNRNDISSPVTPSKNLMQRKNIILLKNLWKN